MTLNVNQIVEIILNRHHELVQDPTRTIEDFVKMSKYHMAGACLTTCNFCAIDREVKAIVILDRLGLKVERGRVESKRGGQSDLPTDQWPKLR